MRSVADPQGLRFRRQPRATVRHRLVASVVPVVVCVLAVATVSGCGGGSGSATGATVAPPGPSGPSTAPTTVGGTAPTLAPTPAPTPAATGVPATTAATAFTSAVATVTAADLGASWHEGCPVGPDQLRRVSVGYWDFDGRARTGALVVHADVVDAVQAVFRRLFEERFPLRRVEPVDRYGASDDASMAADNTSAFNCRRAVRADGMEQWSAHAYGRAIDVNPVENPYLLGSQVLPPEGAAYTDRSDVRPGMAVTGGPLVEAFAASGWQWGGRWTGSPDSQHFSADGG